MRDTHTQFDNARTHTRYNLRKQEREVLEELDGQVSHTAYIH